MALYGTWASIGGEPLQRHSWCTPKKDAEGLATTFSSANVPISMRPTHISVKKCSLDELNADLAKAIESPTMHKPNIWVVAARRGRLPSRA